MRPNPTTVKMFRLLNLLLALDVCIGLLGEVAAHFADLAEMSHFTAVERLRLSLWRADLVLEVNLREIFDAIKATCSLLSFSNNTIIPAEVQRHLHEVCQFDVNNWRTFHDFLTGSNGGRPPRFILATLLSSLVMGVGGYIFGSSHATSQTDTQLLANQEHFVQLLRENDHRAVLMQSEISDLSQLVARNSATTKSVVLLLSIMFLQSKQLAVIFRALETLILDKKLAPGLIAPDLLHAKYEHLTKQLQKQSRHLSIDTELDLFNCPVSFATFTNEVLRIVVHVPVYNTRLGDFTLYKYHNIPVNENGQYFQVQVQRNEYISVSKDHTRHFFLGSLDLERCTAMSQFLSCSHLGGVYRRNVPSCLWGIFSSNHGMVHHSCPLRTMGVTDRFWPLINDKFVVYLGKPDTVFIYCNDRISDSAHFSGLKIVSVPKNCYAVSKSMEFYAGSMVYREDALLKLAPVTIDANKFHTAVFANTSDLTNLLQETARDVHIPMQLPFQPSPWITWGGYLGAGALALVMLTVLALFVKWKRQPQIPAPE